MNTVISPENLFLTVGQVAERLGISTDTVWRWTRVGDFPKPWKMGPNTTRWKLSDIHHYEANLTTCFADAVLDVSMFFPRMAA